MLALDPWTFLQQLEFMLAQAFDVTTSSVTRFFTNNRDANIANVSGQEKVLVKVGNLILRAMHLSRY